LSGQKLLKKTEQISKPSSDFTTMNIPPSFQQSFAEDEQSQPFALDTSSAQQRPRCCSPSRYARFAKTMGILVILSIIALVVWAGVASSSGDNGSAQYHNYPP